MLVGYCLIIVSTSSPEDVVQHSHHRFVSLLCDIFPTELFIFTFLTSLPFSILLMFFQKFTSLSYPPSYILYCYCCVMSSFFILPCSLLICILLNGFISIVLIIICRVLFVSGLVSDANVMMGLITGLYIMMMIYADIEVFDLPNNFCTIVLESVLWMLLSN